MPIETRYEILTPYLHLYCKGLYEFKELKNAFEEAFDLALRNELQKILVDGMELFGKPPTTLERFKLGEYVAELCRQFGRPVYIAVTGEIPIVDPKRFGETVARNRGANGKVFTDLGEAKAWLKV
jgi:hypothetical protein